MASPPLRHAAGHQVDVYLNAAAAAMSQSGSAKIVRVCECLNACLAGCVGNAVVGSRVCVGACV